MSGVDSTVPAGGEVVCVPRLGGRPTFRKGVDRRRRTQDDREGCSVKRSGEAGFQSPVTVPLRTEMRDSTGEDYALALALHDRRRASPTPSGVVFYKYLCVEVRLSDVGTVGPGPLPSIFICPPTSFDCTPTPSADPHPPPRRSRVDLPALRVRPSGVPRVCTRVGS